MRPLLLLSVLLLAQSAAAAPVVQMSGTGRLVSPEKCSPTIGAGANYVENRERLAGKCEHGGEAPQILKHKRNPYIRFTTNQRSGRGNDRAELAYTPMLRFGQEYLISYRIRIPRWAPTHKRGQMFYPLQIWQCSPLSPIAGMRVVQGTSHEVDWIVRSQNSKTPVIAQQKLTPGRWHRVDLTLRPALNSSGLFKVSLDGKQVGQYRGPYGSDKNRCSSPRNSESWRVKFGIYKSNNPAQRYVVDFDDLVVKRK